MDKNTNILGISEKAFLIYKVALRKKSLTVFELSGGTGLPRTSVYHYLDELRENGLIIEEKLKNKKYFRSLEPKFLIKKAKEKVKKTEKEAKQIRLLVRDLNKIVGKGIDKSTIKTYSGIEGAWAITEDILYSRNNSYWLTATKLPFQELATEKEYFRRITHRRKRMRKTKSYIIADESKFSLKLKRQGDTDFREIKILSKNIQLKGTLVVYGRKIAMISFSRSIEGFIIENKYLSDLLRIFFKMIWDGL